MYCSKCGKEVKDGIKFCPYCGNDLSSASKENIDNGSEHIEEKINPENNNKKNKKTIAIVLGIFVLVMIAAVIPVIPAGEDGKQNIIQAILRKYEIINNTVEMNESDDNVSNEISDEEENSENIEETNESGTSVSDNVVSEDYLQNYVHIVEKTINVVNNISHASGDDFGSLYDLNDDGINELILVHDVSGGSNVPPSKVLDVYTVKEDEVVTLQENIVIFSYVGGGRNQRALLGEKDGKKYILVGNEYCESGETLYYTGEFRSFMFNGDKLDLIDNINYICEEDFQENIINHDANYDTYSSLLNKIDVLFTAYEFGVTGSKSDGYKLQELRDYLESKSAE